jgi:hypothetical protein
MTSLLRRLASNGLFKLSINRHREGKFQSYRKREKILAFGGRVHVFVTQRTYRTTPQKMEGPSQQDGPTLTPRIQITTRP